MKELEEKLKSVQKKKSRLITKINELESNNVDKEEEYDSLNNQIKQLTKTQDDQRACIENYQKEIKEKHQNLQQKDALVFDL